MKYNLAFISPTDRRIAYLQILGNESICDTITANSPAELIRALADKHNLYCSSKKDVFKSRELILEDMEK